MPTRRDFLKNVSWGAGVLTMTQAGLATNAGKTPRRRDMTYGRLADPVHA